MNSKIALAIFANFFLTTGVAMARGQHMDAVDLNADGVITQAEAAHAAAGEAQAIDTNADGLITVEEIKAMHERRRQQRMQRQLDRADSNADGSVDLDEFSAHMVERIMHRDRDDDGELSGDELAPPRGRHGPRPDHDE